MSIFEIQYLLDQKSVGMTIKVSKPTIIQISKEMKRTLEKAFECVKHKIWFDQIIIDKFIVNQKLKITKIEKLKTLVIVV